MISLPNNNEFDKKKIHGDLYYYFNLMYIHKTVIIQQLHTLFNRIN